MRDSARDKIEGKYDHLGKPQRACFHFLANPSDCAIFTAHFITAVSFPEM